MQSYEICYHTTMELKNKMEDQYPLIYLSIILKHYLGRNRRLADGDTKRKLVDTQKETLT